MKPPRIAAVLLFLLCALSPHASTADAGIGVRGYVWHPEVSADLRTITAGAGDPRFDLVEDAGLIEKNFGVVEVDVRRGNVHIRAAYTPALMNGNRILERDVVFAGLAYPAGTPVLSHICVDLADAVAQYDPLHPRLGKATMHVGALAGLRYLNARAELHGTTASERRSFATAIAMIGVAARAGFPGGRFRADARLTAGAYSSTRMVEADTFASFALHRNFRLHGGYRYVDMSVEANDIHAEIRLDGPYVGAQLSF